MELSGKLRLPWSGIHSMLSSTAAGQGRAGQGRKSLAKSKVNSLAFLSRLPYYEMQSTPNR